MPIDVLTLSEAQAYAKSYADTNKEAKPAYVTSYEDNAVTLADNTEYFFSEVDTLAITEGIPYTNLKCHMILTAGTTPNITLDVGKKAGDDITEAAAGERWEISVVRGLAICINWGVIADEEPV